jgi:hypothetical protein
MVMIEWFKSKKLKEAEKIYNYHKNECERLARNSKNFLLNVALGFKMDKPVFEFVDKVISRKYSIYSNGKVLIYSLECGALKDDVGLIINRIPRAIYEAVNAALNNSVENITLFGRNKEDILSALECYDKMKDNSKITKAEAINKLSSLASKINRVALIEALEALGLIKFEEKCDYKQYITIPDIEHVNYKIYIYDIIVGLNMIGYKVIKND